MDDTGLQDGMRDYYLSVSGQSDANVEAQLAREAFDVSTLMCSPLKAKNELTLAPVDPTLPSYLAGLKRSTP